MNSSAATLSRTPTVLLVEDLEDDVFFFKHALKRAGLSATIHVGEDGFQAVNYLSHKGQFEDSALYPRPDLVFLDLKMPNMNGFEVLEWLAQNPMNPPLRVVVLTGSEEPTDQVRARELGACGYLIKPPAPDKLAQFFKELAPELSIPPTPPSTQHQSPPLSAGK